MKKCPFCAEEIQDEAVKCRYCAKDLNRKHGCWKNCLLGCLAVFLAMLILAAVLFLVGFLLFKFFLYKLSVAIPNPEQLFRSPDEWVNNMIRSLGTLMQGLMEKIMELFRSGSTAGRTI